MRTITKARNGQIQSHQAQIPPTPKQPAPGIHSNTARKESATESVAKQKRGKKKQRSNALAKRQVEEQVNAVAYARTSWFMPSSPGVFVPPVTKATPPPKPEYPSIKLPKHKSFKWIVRRFRTRRWGFTSTILKRRGLYRKIILRELRNLNLPLGLIVLAGIESNYTPRLVSPTGAMGMWQFIDTTGKAVGLKRTPWIDERRDLVKSTRAALKYVHSLYRQFNGDWGLAIAAYNCGPGCIKAAMERCKGRSIWTMRLWRSCGISKEARAYVARFYALLYFLKHPPNGWKTFPTTEPIVFKTVHTPREISLFKLSKAAGIPLRKLYELNPELSSWTTPPKTRYPLKVPPKFVAKVRQFMKDAPRDFRWKTIKLKEGMKLSSIGRKYRVPRRVLRYVNRTWGRWSMSKRSRLMIPLPKKAKRWPRRLKRKQRKRLYSLAKTVRRFYWRYPAYFRYRSRERYASHKKKLPCYRARKGDTFLRIAKRFKVSVRRLKRRNHHITIIRKGTKIRVFAASRCWTPPPQPPRSFRPSVAN